MAHVKVSSTEHTANLRELFSACEARLRVSPEFRQLVEVLLNVTALHALIPADRQSEVDDHLAANLRPLLGNLAFTACNEIASENEIEFARAVVELAWERTQLFAYAPDGTYVLKDLQRGSAWQTVLWRLFTHGYFVRHLVSAPDRPATLTARAFFAVREILCSALASDVALPPGLDAAARAIAGVDDAQKLDWPIRGQVEHAMEWLAARCGEETETPTGRVLEFRVSSQKQGGRGHGRWLAPWGAAKEFVGCFGARMSTRLHDATRER